jgi:hypothetical protein
MNIVKRVVFCSFIHMASFAMSMTAVAANPHFEAAVEYTPEKGEILLGEPLYVTFSVTNKGTHTFYLETGGDYRLAVRSGRFNFRAADANGIAAKDPHPDASNCGGFLSFEEVKPHSTFSQKLFLPLWIKFDHAGRYLIHVERPLQLFAEEPTLQRPAVTNSGTFDFYVTVLPANPNLLGDCIQRLGEQLRSPAQAVDAAQALAEIDDERVIPHLLYLAETYKEKGGNALTSAIEGLGKHPRADSTQALIKMLGNPDYKGFQYEVIEALANVKSPETKVALRKSLDSPDAFIREEVAKVLGEMGDQESMDALKSHLKDNDFNVRLACSDALADLPPFDKRLNFPVSLARVLDTANPSVTNRYNHEMFALIAANGGPNLSYNYVPHGELTDRDVLENKKALAAMLSWANSPTNVPEH